MNIRKFFKSFSTTYIVAGKRTPIGTFMGKLSKFKAPELGSLTIKDAFASINVSPTQADEVIMGNVCSAGIGQSPARQASLGAGIPFSKPCFNVNKVCASSMKAVTLGAMSIATANRKGNPFGNHMLLDGLAYDGLTDVFNNIAMGLCAEKTAEDLKMSRDLQDTYAIQSYERAIELDLLIILKELRKLVETNTKLLLCS